VTRDEILQARSEFLFPAELHYFEQPLVVARAKGAFVYDSEGREYLDFFGGIVVVSVGHCNEEVNARIREQLDTVAHTSTLLATEPPVRLAMKIAAVAPGRLKKSFFTNSGTEANETAILAARCHTGASDVVALRFGYHGRSAMSMAMTGQSVWRVGPASAPGFTFAQSPYCYRCPYAMTYPDCGLRCAEDVELAIQTTTTGRIAAFIAEPIQGSGGFITPPQPYFQRVQEIVRRYGGLFIADEVQSGWGRTGYWFASDYYGIEPDILCSAKGLGNGFPIGVTVVTDEVAGSIPKMTLSTFGGSPLATTAARAVLDFIEENGLLANAAQLGAYLRMRLEELQLRHPCIGDVRGMGLMQVVELVEDRVTRAPAPALTNRVMEAAREAGALCGKAGLYGNCLRLAPPLNIRKEEMDEFLLRLDRALTLATGPAAPAR
jgi:4-aminobutyrate aminotransferase